MKLATALVALALLIAGRKDDLNKQNPVQRLGLIETALGRPIADQAINSANAVLGARTRAKLRGSWQSAQENDIIVYLIGSTAVPSVYSVMVPNACRCVFVQPTAFDHWMKDHTEALPQMKAVESGTVLAFMLLHEVGHIVHGDPGQFEDTGESVAPNTDITEQKKRESKADSFAVEQLVAALDDRKAIEGWLAAMRIELALSDLSWNMATLRFLNHFGATSLCSRAVFSDAGYTHPNFELRLLTANDMLIQTPVSKQLVEDFMGCRRTPAPVLYEAK